MLPRQYALVAYLRPPLAAFIESLRRSLHPELPYLAAHLTILPPRNLNVSEEDARRSVAEVCREWEAFEVALGEVDTFVPVTPTVFVQVAQGAEAMRALHDRLDAAVLQCHEQWPYVPHLTVAKMATETQVQQAFALAQAQWATYPGPRHVLIEHLTFVGEGQDGQPWVDLAPIPLARPMTASRAQ
jgi:2'-5' RNA ligase